LFEISIVACYPKRRLDFGTTPAQMVTPFNDWQASGPA
jgi:hypothetical protein